MINSDDMDAYPPNIQAVLKRPSGAQEILGLEIKAVDLEASRVELVFHATEKICNKWGGVQGGMVAAMLDDAMALAIGLTLEWGQISPTLEMKASFLSAARPGKILASGWVVRRGRSVAFAEAELKSEDGTIIATGSSTANFVTLKKKEDRSDQ